MGNAAVVIENHADGASVGASSQALAMPASKLLTPHPSERWRSLTSSAWFVLDKGSASSADTAGLFGMTCGVNSTVRLRFSSIDASGAAGDMLDTGPLANGEGGFDAAYGSFIHRASVPTMHRYVRVDISDPDAPFVEGGCVLEGLSEVFDINFAPGASFQHIDRSRVTSTSSGMTLTWDDNTFRRIDLSFEWVTAAQRYGVIERLDRVKGRKRNILLMTDIDSANMSRDSIYGLVTDQTPITFGQVYDIFGKQLRIDERI